MENLKDTTFLIPVRIDSIMRLENLLTVSNFLVENFETTVKVLECAPYCNGLLRRLLDQKIYCYFQEDNDPVLFRTRCINEMALLANTSYVAVWDADVIVPVKQILSAVDLLRNKQADFTYPYKEQFLDTTAIIRKMFLKKGGIEILEKNMSKMNSWYMPNPVGGAFIAEMKSYKEAGLENENFYGWGPEDIERFNRWQKLGYKIERISGPLFHLSHDRGVNSTYQNNDQYNLKNREIAKVRRNNN